MASQPPTSNFALPAVVGLYAETAQSGKSATADVLVSEYGYTVVKFAGPLKDMCRALLLGMGHTSELVERMIEGDLKEEPVMGLKVTTPRAIMQTLGTEWGRECIAADIWVRVAIQKAQEIVGSGGRAVIDDLRFPNEYDALRSIGAECWKVTRPSGRSVVSTGWFKRLLQWLGLVEKPRYEGLLHNHDFDRIIVNDSTLDALHATIYDIMGDSNG